MQDIINNYENLKSVIRNHDHNYYVLDDPEISDREYDELFNQLIEIEKLHPQLVSPESPTQRVGTTPLSSFETYTHNKQMLSLANVFTNKE